MDKETLSNYGWIVILVLILAVMIALATPFGSFIADAIKSTTTGFFTVNQNALDAAGIAIPGQEFDTDENYPNMNRHGFYYNVVYYGLTCSDPEPSGIQPRKIYFEELYVFTEGLDGKVYKTTYNPTDDDGWIAGTVQKMTYDNGYWYDENNSSHLFSEDGKKFEYRRTATFGGTFELYDAEGYILTPPQMGVTYVDIDDGTTYIFYKDNTVTINYADGRAETKSVSWINYCICDVDGYGRVYLEIDGVDAKHN